ncbi:MAG TPA: hypothetical protein VFR73_23490 [Hyphomicrobiaceae bacterium]|nr:hypothetical protein [Hyphomicrobiaceae bacterium]
MAATHNSPSGKGLLLVTMEPPAGLEEEFNDWYDHEHLPQRMRMPGFETGARFVCLEGWPRWLALYDLTSLAALKTPEYLAVSLSNATPWSKRIAARTVGRSRVEAEQVAPGSAMLSPLDRLSRLVVAHYPCALAADLTTDAMSWVTRTADMPGLLQVRLFRSATAASRDFYVVAEFDRPIPSQPVLDAFSAPRQLRARSLNIYAPYRRQ